MSKYLGPAFSLFFCLATLVLALWLGFGTKVALACPLVSGAISLIFGIMVVSDWKTVWGPLLTGKSS